MNDDSLALACMPGLSHGTFRLYSILAAVARRNDDPQAYFRVTLTGLRKIHPGTSGKVAGDLTIVKQFDELRSRGLVETGSVELETQRVLRRDKPDTPILVKLPPLDLPSWEATDGTPLRANEAHRLIDL